MVKKLSTGQSLVELVISVGIIVLVLTAVISLVVASLHSRTSGYDRKKATELGQKVMEKLIEEKQQHAEDFWGIGTTAFWIGKNLGTTQTMTGYDGYFYVINFSPEAGCSVPCATATINVGYSGQSGGNVKFSRFFSK